MWHKRILYTTAKQPPKRNNVERILTSIHKDSDINIFEHLFKFNFAAVFTLAYRCVRNYVSFNSTFAHVDFQKIKHKILTHINYHHKLSQKMGDLRHLLKASSCMSSYSCRRPILSLLYSSILCPYYYTTSDRWWKGKAKAEKENCLKWLFKNRNLWRLWDFSSNLTYDIRIEIETFLSELVEDMDTSIIMNTRTKATQLLFIIIFFGLEIYEWTECSLSEKQFAFQVRTIYFLLCFISVIYMICDKIFCLK